MSPLRVTRRVGLVALVALVAAPAVSACTSEPRTAPRAPGSAAPSPPTPEPDPDIALAATILAQEQTLAEAVAATADAFPRLRPLLAPAREGHEAHVRLLEDAVPDSSPSASPTLGGVPQQDRARVPRDRPAALRRLADLERELGLAGQRAAFAAESGAFARVLASMAASAAQWSATLQRQALAR